MKFQNYTCRLLWLTCLMLVTLQNATAQPADLTHNTSVDPSQLKQFQTFSYQFFPSYDGVNTFDGPVLLVSPDPAFHISGVSTGAYNNLSNFTGTEGVRVSYKKNTAPGVFTLWGSSPDVATNTDLSSSPPGLAAGEYITAIKWEYQDANKGMEAIASFPPKITGEVINPDINGNPNGQYTATNASFSEGSKSGIIVNFSTKFLSPCASIVTFDGNLAGQCVTNTNYTLTGGSPAGGIYSGDGVSGNNFNASLAGVGTHTITYTFTEEDGCMRSALNSITVSATPTVSFGGDLADQCVNSTTYELTGGSPAGGTYGGIGVSGTNFNASIGLPGITRITYTYKDANGCSNSAANTITVRPLPAVSFEGTLADQCIDNTTYTLTGGSPAGGTYSGDGVSGTNFNASIAGAGAHTITYTYTGASGCTNSAGNTITVNPLPAVSFQVPLLDQCLNGTVYSLFGASPTGGIYSGDGVSGTNFNASVAGLGKHTITYTYTNENGCTKSAANPITVNELPTVSFEVTFPDQCINNTTYTLTGGSPAGGIYRGDGVSGTNFNASLAGPGSHTITYTYSTSDGCLRIGCTNSATTTITVTSLPTVSFGGTFPDQCINNTTYTLTGGSPAGGTYTGDGASGSNFNASIAGPGTHTITYTYSTGGCTGSANNTITVDELPIVSFGGSLANQCINNTTYTLTGGSPAGGTYSGDGVSGNNFNASIAGAGLHTITYTYTGGSGCTNSATNTIMVNTLPTVSFGGTLAGQCAGNITYELTGGLPAGGIYSGDGASGTNFNASIAGVGIHTITYTYTAAGGCTNSATNTITVNASPAVSFGGTLAGQCLNNTTYLLTGGLPAGGTYSGDGVTGSNFNASVAGAGSHTITYTYTGGGNCTGSATNTITVTELPIVSGPPGSSVCINATAFTLTGGIPSGGSYSGTGVTSEVFNPAIAGTGPHSIVYSYTNGKACSSSAGFIINVIAPPSKPAVSVVNTCGSSILSTTCGGTLLWNTGAKTASITVTSPGTYTVTQMVNGCTSPPGSGIAAPKTAPAKPVVIVINNCGSSVLSTTCGETLLWNTGAKTASITVASAGTYSVTQTANSCTSVAGSGIAAPKATPAKPVVSVVNNCGSSTLSTSCAGSTMLWSTGAKTPSITVTSAGTYSVTQTVNGCSSAAGSGIAAPKAAPAKPVVSVVNNCGSTILSTSCAGSTMLWSTGAKTPSITVTSAATYSVTQTVNGCTSTAGSGIAAPKAAPAKPLVTVVNSCGSSKLSTTCTGSLLWSTGAKTTSIAVTAAGTYTLTQTANGCTSAAGSGSAAPNKIAAVTAANVSVFTTLNACNVSVALGSNVTITGTPASTLVYKIGSAVIKSPYVFSKGSTTVSVVATNSCGSATKTFLVTVNDNQKPSITCKPNASRTTTASQYTVLGTEFNATTSDNCGTPSLVYCLSGATVASYLAANTSLAGKKLNKGITTITWKATDRSDNTAACTTTVTVSASKNVVNATPLLASVFPTGKQVSEPAFVPFTVKVMPNPTSYYFTLQLNSQGYEKFKIKITDVTGRVMEQRTDVPANSTLQLGNVYHPGVYIAEILQGTNKVVLRLIKEGR